MDVVAPAGPMDRVFGTQRALVRWAFASLVTNCILIVTGAVVRLTASGLGCDTWPRCNNENYTPHGESGIHGYIEFGNRLLTFVLLALAIGTVLAAVRSRASRRVRTLAWLTMLGIPLQGVIGGITVLTHLNPWVVALHLLATILIVVWCTDLLQKARNTASEPLPAALRRAVVALFWLLMVAIWLGTSVTGAGPHAGDSRARRNGLPILWIARVHAWTVDISVVLVCWLLWMCRRLGLHRAARWTGLLLAAMLLQGLIGYLQFALGVPVGLVVCHMVGIGLVTIAVSWLYYGTHRFVD